MWRRLAIGLVKGLVLGAIVGAGFHYGMGARSVGFTLGILIAMGTGATAAVFAGKPPWRQEAWVEAVLKAAVGLGLGALVYWLGATYADVVLPAPFGVLPPSTSWTHLPLVFAPIIGALFGALVEIDNTDESATRTRRSPRARASELDVWDEDEGSRRVKRRAGAP